MKRLLLLLLTFLFAGTAFGQVSLEVSVINQKTAQPVNGLTVTLTNASIGYSQESTTNKQGKIIFRGLSTAGSYTATTANTDSYYSLEAADIQFRSNTNKSVTIGIAPKSTQELDEITVRDSKSIARINTIDAEVSAELNAEQIENIPIRARDFEQALFRLLNVVKATTGFETAPDISVNGGDPLFTNYLIDGLDNNENFLGGSKFPIPTGFIQNITVLSNNYTAEFGQSVDGVFNVTTKSGSNNLDGEVFFVTRPGPAIDTDSPSNFRQDNDAQDGFQRYQGGFGIGGPIVKDKTFFYLNAEGTINLNDNVLDSPALGFSEELRGEDKLALFSGKIDHNWSDSFRSSLRGNVGLVEFERQGGSFFFPSSSFFEDRDSYIIANKNTYVSSAFTSETSLQYSRFYWDFSRPANPDSESPDVTILDPNFLPVGRIGAPGFPFVETENTGQFKQKFTFSLGDHQLKTGAGFITSDFVLSGGGNPFGSYTVQLTPDQLSQLRAQNVEEDLSIEDLQNLNSEVQVANFSINVRSEPFGTVQNRYNAYVEDLWTVNDRLNLTLGLRYDYDNLSKGGDDDGDYNNFGPRFNFNYRLTNRSVIRGGYGRFFQKVVYSIVSDAREFNRNNADIRQQVQGLIDAGALPDDTDLDQVLFPGALQASGFDVDFLEFTDNSSFQDDVNSVFSNTIRIDNPNGYDNPRSDQFVIGYQRQLNDELLFSVDAFYNRSREEFRLRELNSPEPFFVDEDFQPQDVRSPRDADATRTTPILYTDEGQPFALVNGDSLFGASRTVSTVESEGESDYYAATFNLTKNRGDDDYSFQLFYTLSQLETNTEGFNFRAVDANRFDEEFGPSANDRTHVLEGFFTYYPANGLSITTTTQIQSGQPINRVPDASVFGTTDLNGNGIGRAFEGTSFSAIADRTPGASRNGDRLPWATTFDVGVQYKLPIGGDQRIKFRADIFNVFNTENLSGFINDSNPSNQFQVGPASSGNFTQRAASPPRQFQFSLSYLF
jgi:outer membrane receptor protein involved in Fe transport